MKGPNSENFFFGGNNAAPACRYLSDGKSLYLFYGDTYTLLDYLKLYFFGCIRMNQVKWKKCNTVDMLIMLR